MLNSCVLEEPYEVDLFYHFLSIYVHWKNHGIAPDRSELRTSNPG